MGKVAGRKIVLQIGGKTLVGYRTHNFDYEQDLADATTGESTNMHKEYEPMFKGGTFSIEGLYDPTAGSNLSVDDVIDLLHDGTICTLKWGNTETGSIYWSASGYIKKVHEGADYTDLATFTIDVTISGDITSGTVGT